jgi:hypothetical protein
MKTHVLLVARNSHVLSCHVITTESFVKPYPQRMSRGEVRQLSDEQPSDEQPSPPYHIQYVTSEARHDCAKVPLNVLSTCSSASLREGTYTTYTKLL